MKRDRTTTDRLEREAVLVAQSVEALGSAAFYVRLLSLLDALVDNDLVALVRYSKSGAPDMILPHVEPTPAMRSYTEEFYIYDPFHLHWTQSGEPGVFCLRSLAPRIGGSRYAREFLSQMKIFDEIAVILPPLGEAAPTLILDRSDGPFTRREVTRVKTIFPLLAALHRQHLNMLVMKMDDLILQPAVNARPLRIIDQNGSAIYATGHWVHRTVEGDSPLVKAIDELGDTGPCLKSLGNGMALRRTRLPNDFGAAPNGFCDEIVPDPFARSSASIEVLPDALATRLTPRERDVVRLTLRGYPVIEIARRLSLSRGTVKNYRLAIYRKLDITTERELFGEFISALGGP